MWSSDARARRRSRPRGLLLAALCAASTWVSACGFHMVGSGPPWPAILQRPYLSLKDPYTDFSRELEHQLKAVGADLQPLAAGASASIDVSRDSIEQRTLSVSASNIPTEYLLIYTVTFSVRSPDRELLAPQTVTLQQDYSFAENVVLAKEHEADILRAQMARNIAAIVMHRLASLK